LDTRNIAHQNDANSSKRSTEPKQNLKNSRLETSRGSYQERRGSRTYLGDSQTSKGDTGTGTRGLVHLTEDKSDLGLAIKLNDGSLLHLVVQIVTLTGTLTDTGEDGETTVGLGNVVLARR
jgi:hypothetical protein